MEELAPEAVKIRKRALGGWCLDVARTVLAIPDLGPSPEPRKEHTLVCYLRQVSIFLRPKYIYGVWAG